MMPRRNRRLQRELNRWMRLKNDGLDGEAGLQISVNSTHDDERTEMFNDNSLELHEVSSVLAALPAPLGRKITLNFAVAGWEIDAQKLSTLFCPSRFIVKLTPMHMTTAAEASGLVTPGDPTEYHPYEEHEEALKAEGFDVLVFIASKEEDESLITCGNAILSGSVPSSGETS